MADSSLKQKIHDVLKNAYFKDASDLVDVSDGPDDDIHIVIVSRKFDGRRMKEKKLPDLVDIGATPHSRRVGEGFLIDRHKPGRDQGYLTAHHAREN